MSSELTTAQKIGVTFGFIALVAIVSWLSLGFAQSVRRWTGLIETAIVTAPSPSYILREDGDTFIVETYNSQPDAEQAMARTGEQYQTTEIPTDHVDALRDWLRLRGLTGQAADLETHRLIVYHLRKHGKWTGVSESSGDEQ